MHEETINVKNTMKKRLLLILLFIISLSSYSQEIQNTFFDCSFGVNQAHVLSQLEENSILVSSQDKKTVETFNISLGGFNFDYSTWSFVDDKFYMVSFTASIKNKIYAWQTYNSIKKLLKSKYGLPTHGEGNSIYWNDQIDVADMNIECSKSKKGDMRYYVTLVYWNRELFSQAIDIQKNEL